MNINAKTKPCFLLGHPVSHSKSPIFQNAAFEAAGINAVYLALDLDSNSFDQAVNGLRSIEILGLNITLPWKREIMKFCQVLDESASKIGAVNTVTVTDGIWQGHNTDWYGVYRTLENNRVDRAREVLLVGAGGATPGVIHGLKEYGITAITITNRTMSKAEELAKKQNIGLLDFSIIRKHLDRFSMVINCTSIPFQTIVTAYNSRVIYFDLQYYSEPIPARHYIDGRDMLLYQGAKAFELWTGTSAPVDVMQQALAGD
jgi:shikimate dehydrogenase